MPEANEREIELATAIDDQYTLASETSETLDEAEHRCVALLARALADYREELGAQPPAAVPMLLWCPECSARHIDVGEFATKRHHTHACQNCGHCWRPAVVHTSGVRFLPGFKNEEPAASAGAPLEEEDRHG